VGRFLDRSNQEGAAMNLFAGLDISLNETSICIIDADGKIRHETKVLSEPEAIRV
jgi:transposase